LHIDIQVAKSVATEKRKNWICTIRRSKLKKKIPSKDTTADNRIPIYNSTYAQQTPQHVVIDQQRCNPRQAAPTSPTLQPMTSSFGFTL
jgi:hypothetical protein